MPESLAQCIDDLVSLPRASSAAYWASPLSSSAWPDVAKQRANDLSVLCTLHCSHCILQCLVLEADLDVECQLASGSCFP